MTALLSNSKCRRLTTIVGLFGVVLLLPLGITVSPRPANATDKAEEIPQEAQVIEHLNAQVALDLPFQNENGEDVTLRQEMIPNRPTILAPVYYGCGNLCTFTLNALVEVLNNIDEKIGTDYKVIGYSINPEEGPALAKEKAANYYAELKSPEDGPKGWRFLTGSESTSKTLSDQIGFHYKRDGKDYIHASIFVVLTPDGRVSRYFYGIKHNPRDVRLALVEASEGKFGSTFDRFLLFCFRWDHLQGKYSFVAWNLVRYTSIAVVIALFAGLIAMRVKEIKGLKGA